MTQSLDESEIRRHHKTVAASQWRQKCSLRFSTLSAKMELEVDHLSDDDDDESDNLTMKNS